MEAALLVYAIVRLYIILAQPLALPTELRGSKYLNGRKFLSIIINVSWDNLMNNNEQNPFLLPKM